MSWAFNGRALIKSKRQAGSTQISCPEVIRAVGMKIDRGFFIAIDEGARDYFHVLAMNCTS
jgi:hypothetical protein